MKLRVFALVAVVAAPSLSASAAPYSAAAFQLELDGAGKIGFVKSIDGGEESRPLAVSFAEVTPALATLVSAFADGKPVAKKLVFANNVTIKRSQETRLLRVRLPSMGDGGSSDVVLSFTPTPLVASPWLSAKNVALPAPAKKIADARVDAGQGIRVAKLSALEIAQAGGRSSVSDITIEGEPGSLPAMSAWAKSKSPRAVTIDYVDPDVKPILKLRLDGCVPKSFVATPATMTLACGAVRG